MKEADIVVTNPPFSLFKEYLPLLIKYKKKFIVLGNMNAFANREIFPYFRENKCWYGITGRQGAKYFVVPKGRSYHKIIDGIPMKSATVQWFTNLDHKKRHEYLTLTEKYNSDKHPKYDNYNAIEVGRTLDIPKDYFDIMAVPISFMDKYNPEQFELIGVTDNNKTNPLCTKIYGPEDSDRYSSLNGRAVLKLPDGSLKKQYARILIRRIK